VFIKLKHDSLFKTVVDVLALIFSVYPNKKRNL
jgi:hypothetical protein